MVRKAGHSGHLECRSARVLMTRGPGFRGVKTHEQICDTDY